MERRRKNAGGAPSTPRRRASSPAVEKPKPKPATTTATPSILNPAKNLAPSLLPLPPTRSGRERKATQKVTENDEVNQKLREKRAKEKEKEGGTTSGKGKEKAKSKPSEEGAKKDKIQLQGDVNAGQGPIPEQHLAKELADVIPKGGEGEEDVRPITPARKIHTIRLITPYQRETAERAKLGLPPRRIYLRERGTPGSRIPVYKRELAIPIRTKPFLTKSTGEEKSENKSLPPNTISVSELLTKEDMPALSMPLPKEASFGRRSSIIQPTAGEMNGAREQGKAEKVDGKAKVLERNIDSVVFGDVLFKSWYWSGYPKEIVGEAKANGEGKEVVKTLYVCKKCFGYAKVVEEWVRHCRVCAKGVPGRRIYGAGAWSVWEVDGEEQDLFCQNLSLFAKLFLDNKSVFFDVAGFNYFLLVHTSPTGDQQIVGFFSKEKMSWDKNNLACILIFPPWQRKGLGAILIGISYEISRRENILGGPEKPISELGMKGYKRFWGAEIARWLLAAKGTDKKKGKGMVSVEQISTETWIYAEDCLGVLREMGVVEKAGKGKGEEGKERVRIDKDKVREWVEKMGLDLRRAVDPEGFVEGYGYREESEELST